MTPNPPLTDAEILLIEAYTAILNEPFEDKYDDRWEDEPFDRAVDAFKARAEEIGFEDAFEVLARFNVKSYESLRAHLKKGPAMCFRPGWKSPLLGEKIDPVALVSKCRHMSGPEFTGGYRVVVLDFWASWCDPCIQSGPELSDLADEFSGRIAVIGINNESIFGETREPDIEHMRHFLDDNQDGFRYTIFVDSVEGYAKDNVYNPGQYRGIPCVILIVDGVVQYVGSPQETFRPTLEEALEAVEASSAREE
ncbi:hypothetical protein BGZ98_009272 [Dissophora globulifera]|nr:hypothetical protein BGZ98_009272 [Dissophora globulifera]